MKIQEKDNPQRWYVLRVSAGGMTAFLERLRRSGIESYHNGDAFRDVCFVRSDMAEIDRARAESGPGVTVHYLWDGVSFRPAEVPDRLMRDFIRVAESGGSDTLYLDRVSALLKDCQRVRVRSGQYHGIEGNLVRIKKTKRVLVALPGDIAVATGYVRAEEVEAIH